MLRQDWVYSPTRILCWALIVLHGIENLRIKTVFYGVSIICIAYVMIQVLFYFGILTSVHSDSQKIPNARKNVEKNLHEKTEKARIDYPPKGLLIRTFKHEEELEIWASNEIDGKYILLKTYPIAKQSGIL